MTENRFQYLRHEWVAKHGEKLSQRRLAEETGIGLGTIKNMERGVHHPDIQTQILLARFYGISRAELMARDGFNGHGRGDPSEAS